MDSLELISTLLNERIMLGKKENLTDTLSIVPVYKAKINFFNVNTDIKNTTGDGSNVNLLITPVSILQIKNDTISIIKFEEKTPKEDIFDIIPNIMSNIDMNSIIKNIKLS